MGIRARCRGAGLLVVAAVMGSSCTLDVELENTPEPVQVGQEVTFTMKATNNGACPVPATEIYLAALLSQSDVDAINQALMELSADLGITLTLEQICGGGDELALAARQADLEKLREALGTVAFAPGSEGAAACSESMIPFLNWPALACPVGPFASGGMETVETSLTASQVGTFLNVLMGPIGSPGVCAAGSSDPGKACASADDCGGALNSCKKGICAAGMKQGTGCTSDTDCDGETCTPCRSCAGDSGLCTGETMTACTIDDDCPSDEDCVCGTSIACTTTTVLSIPQGGACTDTAQCATDLVCSDGVCCNRECDGPSESCDLPINPGVCIQEAAAAPAASPAWLIVGVLALAAIGGIMLRRSRRLSP